MISDYWYSEWLHVKIYSSLARFQVQSIHLRNLSKNFPSSSVRPWTSKNGGKGVVFTVAVDGDCGRLDEVSSTYECLFFSTIGSSTTIELVKSVKDTRIVVASDGQSRRKRRFRSGLDKFNGRRQYQEIGTANDCM